MTDDFDFGILQWLGFVLVVVPFLVPVVTVAVAVRVSWADARALWWGVALGVVNVPFSWAAIKFGVDVWNPFWEHGLGAWFLAMVVSAAVTALVLWCRVWWRSRAQPRRS